jgi:hypothetical protein
LTGKPGPLSEDVAHPTLGWIDTAFDGASFEPRAAPELAGRRPVLLFGDSFIRCMTNKANCFQGWMERSAWDATHQAYNYGVRGYGIDQIAMLARATLPRWRGTDPLVVIGIYMDDDLDRAWLDFRGWPKPRLCWTPRTRSSPARSKPGAVRARSSAVEAQPGLALAVARLRLAADRARARADPRRRCRAREAAAMRRDLDAARTRPRR